jgi:hypothetical protein
MAMPETKEFLKGMFAKTGQMPGSSVIQIQRRMIEHFGVTADYGVSQLNLLGQQDPKDRDMELINKMQQFAMCAQMATKEACFTESQREEFYKEICPEKWLLDSGRLNVFGSEWMEEIEKARKKAEKDNAKKLNFEEAEDKFDSLGNKIEVVKEKKELSRSDKKSLLKKKKEMEKEGLDTYEIDQLLGIE